MREPNPPSVRLDGLDDDAVRRIIRLALLVVADLASGKEWAALEKYQYSRMDETQHIAFWSLLDSAQRSHLKEMARLADENAGNHRT